MKSNAVNSLLIVFDLCGPENVNTTLASLVQADQAGPAFSPSQTLANPRMTGKQRCLGWAWIFIRPKKLVTGAKQTPHTYIN